MRYRMTSAALVAALLAGACGDAGVRDPVDPAEPGEPAPRRVEARGIVFGLDGTLPEGLEVSLDGSPRVWAAVNADGSFAIEGMVTGDSVSVIIDVATGSARSTFPALVRIPAHTPVGIMRVVLVPMHWTVQGGSYDGRTAGVSVDAAFRPPCSNTNDTNCDGYFPASWLGGIRTWPSGALPVRLAFDHERSHRPISPADSAGVWRAVNRMNDDAGLPLFRPARAEEVGLSTAGTPSAGVVIRVDTTLAGFGAWANWWWDGNGDVYAGVVRTRDLNALRHDGLMTHELLHTHGLKHSCSWSTVMGGYGCGSTPGLSLHDVAYYQLARRVRDVEIASGARHGLVAALQGERVVLRNLPLFALPHAGRLAAMRADSIIHGDHAH